MTISMPARRRWPSILAAGVVGIVVGLVVGLAIAGGDDQTDPVSALRDSRATAVRAASILETVPIEYGQAVQGGGASQEGIRGAEGAVERSRSVYREVREVIGTVDPQTATEIDHRYSRLEGLIRVQRPAPAVNRATGALQARLRGALGG